MYTGVDDCGTDVYFGGIYVGGACAGFGGYGTCVGFGGTDVGGNGVGVSCAVFGGTDMHFI